ncbi:MAG: YceI family protein [Candidatus Uhrbacteria bacterium GW2011_GWA2_52_8d]|uniref:YceI family protein n=1 Tax=Candidatus Uhrbacteria bacterium GW2011_GWA2_52_8d TaxID=1618979 RepID=A0A0G1XP61_9BACT|nr:MAG: YceI family protein [Candidatus Uhrbacteria bacterium GW2011_GWA2_52_8d]
MFKHFFPTLLVPILLLGAGCTQTVSVSVEPVVEEAAVEGQGETTAEVMFEDGNYIVAPPSTTRTATSIVWNAQKRVGAKHNGTVDISSAAFLVEQRGIVGGTVVVEMRTIVDLDLTDEQFNTMLVNHLKSEDFFFVETYPTATFAIFEVTQLEGIEGATHRVSGDMTIKGTTNEISFPASFVQTDGGIQVTGTATLDRTLWDVRFGSDKFFDNLGDGLIEDEFTLTFDMLFTASK